MSRGTAARHCAFGRNLHSKCSKCSSSRPYENILGVSWKVRMQTPQAHAQALKEIKATVRAIQLSGILPPSAARRGRRPAPTFPMGRTRSPHRQRTTSWQRLPWPASAPYYPALQLHLQFSVLRRALTTHVTCDAGAAKPKRKSATRARCSRAVRSRVYTAPGK